MASGAAIPTNRSSARGELGNNFNIRGFHDAILSSGPVPLDILEEKVDAWNAKQKSG
ncbi:DUF885 family protein [Altererythrobacter sp.]|uniref:DUF885 family protein n=1 Tax=Altererythrobacter sp. TaxID=1872480 RepID=UPI003CFDB406